MTTEMIAAGLVLAYTLALIGLFGTADRIAKWWAAYTFSRHVKQTFDMIGQDR